MNCQRSHRTILQRGAILILALFVPLSAASAVDEEPTITVEGGCGELRIVVGDAAIARYCFQDPQIPRPYFCDIIASNGTQVTRNHPPVEGVDKTDHPTYHPGIWLAFGDINGADFWRNKAHVRHDRFVAEPETAGNELTFAVENVYEAEDGTEVCREQCTYRFVTTSLGYWMLQRSEFFSDDGEFVFGDQEEMGLGIRVATPLNVSKGGRILNSHGHKNGGEAWGKTAAWCDYSGLVDGQRVGMCMVPHPDNFRPSWFHARDYGLLLANPFGRNAFTGGEKSAIPVAQGERLILRFGILIHSGDPADTIGPRAAQEYGRLAGTR
ncbi:MAG: hypothetical protein GY851_30360 [bacterium]|nr:hypothetical protein [bacterium]